jgi:hypothetical protein
VIFFILSRRKGKNNPTANNLVSIAVVLVLVGFVNFGENRLIGNILIGSGVLVAIIFVITNYRNKNKS